MSGERDQIPLVASLWIGSGAEVCGTNFFNPVPNPGLSKFPNQNQIQNRDSDLIQNKTKSKTETQIWL